MLKLIGTGIAIECGAKPKNVEPSLVKQFTERRKKNSW